MDSSHNPEHKGKGDAFEAKKIAAIANEVVEDMTPEDAIWLLKRCSDVATLYSQLSSYKKHEAEFKPVIEAISSVKDIILTEAKEAEPDKEKLATAFAQLTRALQKAWEMNCIVHFGKVGHTPYNPEFSTKLVAKTNSKIKSEHASRLVGLILEEIGITYSNTQALHMNLKLNDKSRYNPVFDIPADKVKGHEIYVALEANPLEKRAKHGRRTPAPGRS